MASLISYKLIVREENQVKGAYFRYFTAANICFLMILLVFTLFSGAETGVNSFSLKAVTRTCAVRPPLPESAGPPPYS